MTLNHIIIALGGFIVGMIVTLIIVEKPYEGDDVEELLKRK